MPPEKCKKYFLTNSVSYIIISFFFKKENVNVPHGGIGTGAVCGPGRAGVWGGENCLNNKLSPFSTLSGKKGKSLISGPNPAPWLNIIY